MNLLDKLRYSRIIKKARRVESIPDGCHFHPIFENSIRNGEYVICPMKSGKMGLLQMKVWTPFDPGDQHFYSHKFICYVD